MLSLNQKGVMTLYKHKTKIIVISCILIVLGIVSYLFLGIISDKPGMDGFAVTNGMIRMLISGKDYVKVGENRYLFRGGKLGEIMQNEYDSYDYMDYYVGGAYKRPLNLDDFEDDFSNDSMLLKVAVVSKNGEQFKGGGVNVWNPLVKNCYSVYYYPYSEFLEKNPEYVVEK